MQNCSPTLREAEWWHSTARSFKKANKKYWPSSWANAPQPLLLEGQLAAGPRIRIVYSMASLWVYLAVGWAIAPNNATLPVWPLELPCKTSGLERGGLSFYWACAGCRAPALCTEGGGSQGGDGMQGRTLRVFFPHWRWMSGGQQWRNCGPVYHILV